MRTTFKFLPLMLLVSAVTFNSCSNSENLYEDSSLSNLSAKSSSSLFSINIYDAIDLTSQEMQSLDKEKVNGYLYAFYESLFATAYSPEAAELLNNYEYLRYYDSFVNEGQNSNPALMEAFENWISNSEGFEDFRLQLRANKQLVTQYDGGLETYVILDLSLQLASQHHGLST